jgi:hypothetical protein
MESGDCGGLQCVQRFDNIWKESKEIGKDEAKTKSWNKTVGCLKFGVRLATGIRWQHHTTRPTSKLL